MNISGLFLLSSSKLRRLKEILHYQDLVVTPGAITEPNNRKVPIYRNPQNDQNENLNNMEVYK